MASFEDVVNALTEQTNTIAEERSQAAVHFESLDAQLAQLREQLAQALSQQPDAADLLNRIQANTEAIKGIVLTPTDLSDTAASVVSETAPNVPPAPLTEQSAEVSTSTTEEPTQPSGESTTDPTELNF